MWHQLPVHNGKLAQSLLPSIFVGLNVPYKYIYCDFHPPEFNIDAERQIYVTGSSTHKKICCLSYPQLTYDTYVDFLLNSSRSICFPEISYTYGNLTRSFMDIYQVTSWITNIWGILPFDFRWKIHDDLVAVPWGESRGAPDGRSLVPVSSGNSAEVSGVNMAITLR